jgi:hypothetical protein
MATENNCACVDCKYNEDEMCTAPGIDLEYGPDGRSCVCKTYDPIREQQGVIPPNLGSVGY